MNFEAYTFAQCRFGCRAEKLTDIMSNLPELEEFNVKCNMCNHLRGRKWAMPERKWDPSMLRNQEPDGDCITRSCAAYPAGLNKALANALYRRRGKKRASAEPMTTDKSAVEHTTKGIRDECRGPWGKQRP
jgi:hypothetical protein